MGDKEKLPPRTYLHYTYLFKMILTLPFVFLLLTQFSLLEVTTTDDLENNLSCALCMTLMEILDENITDPTNEQMVADFLDNICFLLPHPQEDECHTLISEYVDDILELLVNQYLAPQLVCDEIQLCP